MLSQEEEGVPDLQLSLDCGNTVDIPQTPHTPQTPQDAEPQHPAEPPPAETLVLSRTELKDVPEWVLINGTLKHLYLEGNRISHLPGSVFTSLPRLLWLDLRNNQIAALPADIGSHRSLKTLLLEGNPLSELPPELGNVITLRALNLRNCPIRFPPQDVVHRGLQCILQYLRSAMAERPVSVHKSHPVNTPKPSRPPCDIMPPVEKLQLSETVRSSMEMEEEEEESVDEDELRRFRELKHKMILMDRAELGYGGPVLPVASSPRRAHSDGNLKSSALPLIKRKKEVTKANIISELPPFDMRHWDRSEGRRLAAMKRLKEKQITLQQRKQDQELLHEWRMQAKIMQERKMVEYTQEMHEKQMRQEAELGVADRSDPPQRAQRPPGSQKECEETRAARDHALEQRIRAHIQMMQQRCRRPGATAAEETAAAQRDMEETRKLHAELQERKQGRGVDYRFVAFTGDNTQRFFDK
ncbi:leucine-rich repeat-containing protein 27-like [Diretmus argenteus]